MLNCITRAMEYACTKGYVSEQLVRQVNECKSHSELLKLLHEHYRRIDATPTNGDLVVFSYRGKVHFGIHENGYVVHFPYGRKMKRIRKPRITHKWRLK